MKPLQPTEERHEQALRVNECIELLASFLAGRGTRADIARWTRQLWPPGSGQGSPFMRHEVAHTVFESIWNIEIGRDATQAAEDLVECLALAGPEITYWDKQVEIERLPRWSLCRQDDNGQRYEMTTFLSYARATREAEVFERRGHKQSYWVERKNPAK
jgi:hypothetical protein